MSPIERISVRRSGTNLMVEWITNTVNSLGYLGIGLLMFLENIFPPIPSELIMPLAGFTATQPNSNIQLLPAILAGVVGTVLGALPWYYAGKILGTERLARLADRYGRWLTISSKDITRADGWFDRHGAKAVLMCRLVPGVRTLISLPAGISEMHLLPFLIYSTVGTVLWVSFLAYAGYALGNNYHVVEEYIDPISKIVLASIVAAFLIIFVRRTMRRSL